MLGLAMITPICELAAKIRAAGPVIDPRGMAALYAPMQEREPYVGTTITRNLSYGIDPQNLADKFAPTCRRDAIARPVLIFVHGWLHGRRTSTWLTQPIL